RFRRTRLLNTGINPDEAPCMPGDVSILRTRLNDYQLEETFKRAREAGITEDQINTSSNLLSEMDLAPRARRPRVNLLDGSLDYSRQTRSIVNQLEPDCLPPIKPVEHNASKIEFEADRTENSFYALTARGREYLNAPFSPDDDILGGILSDEE
ncbi:hypothetical protein L0F63_004028, partial [Massospora cicadina]